MSDARRYMVGCLECGNTETVRLKSPDRATQYVVLACPVCSDITRAEVIGPEYDAT